MTNLFALVSALFSMTVYDRVVPNNAFASLTALSIGLGIVVVFDFVLRILRAYFIDLAGADIDREVGTSVFARLMAIRLDRTLSRPPPHAVPNRRTHRAEVPDSPLLDRRPTC